MTPAQAHPGDEGALAFLIIIGLASSIVHIHGRQLRQALKLFELPFQVRSDRLLIHSSSYRHAGTAICFKHRRYFSLLFCKGGGAWIRTELFHNLLTRLAEMHAEVFQNPSGDAVALEQQA